jgi:hypothetical protein
MKTPILTRNSFIKKSLLATSGLFSVPLWLSAQQDRPAPLNQDEVKEFVGASHGKFDRVKEMLQANPQLLHSSYDWGGGDFESGIEAAGHVGNKEIAAYFLEKGARYNIYLACMLGHLDIVKSVLTSNPGLLNSKGPHGFTMLHHAQKGTANHVEEYLKSLGAVQTKLDFYKS